jgi:hypothetical protein
MSDINDLIHTQAKIAYNQGVDREQQRIIKIIKEGKCVTPDQAFFLIKAISVNNALHEEA